RGATFTASGFKPDFHYGAYQHQGAFDSESMWKFTSDSTSEDISSQIVMAFDPMHVYEYEGGSELAIPWDALYGLGPGLVPPGTTVGFAASVCWDPEPDGELGGDSAPNNISASLPTIDNFLEMLVDCDNDGRPDPDSLAGVGDLPDADMVRLYKAYPSPTMAGARVPLYLAASPAGKTSRAVEAHVYDIAGRRVKAVYSGQLPPGRHEIVWDGTNAQGAPAGAGIYFMRVTVDNRSVGTAKVVRMQ
ncbi:MAG: FlgD immunoglobulin-like domain containing protein, partial [bacterium]